MTKRITTDKKYIEAFGEPRDVTQRDLDDYIRINDYHFPFHKHDKDRFFTELNKMLEK